jgi:hypothetical protein
VKEALGLDAVPLVPTLVAFACFASAALLARQLGASWLLAVAIADVTLYVVVPRMICRAEVFGYLYFALALGLLASYTRGRRARSLAWLLPLTLLWVNSHGSFLLLFGLIPLAATGLFLDSWRRSGFRREALAASLFSRDSALLGATWLLAAATLLANPYGFALIRSAAQQSTSGLWRQAIEEWEPIYAGGGVPARFVVCASLVSAGLLLGFRRLSFVSVLLAGCLGALAFASHRHLALFGIGAAWVLGDFARGARLGPGARTAVAASLIAALVAANAFAAAATGFRDRSLARNPSPFLTERGLEFILRNVRGNVLNRWSLGGLLIYFGYPQIRVCIDSRADPYPPAYFQRYQRALFGTARETQSFVDAYAIDHIIIDRELYAKSFRQKLGGLAGFRPVFSDERTVVLSRATPPPRVRGAGPG